MNTTVRLIILLTIAVGLVMAAASYITLRQREAALQRATHDELRAHAYTLQIAIERDYRSGRMGEAQQLIDRLSDNPKIYGVALFDKGGRVVMVSDPLIPDEAYYPDQVRQVILTGKPVEISYMLNEEELFSIIMPVRVDSAIHGAFEIMQPMSFVKADIARARRNMTITTLVLLVTIFLVVMVVTRRSLAGPIMELLSGAEAVAHGDLDHRVVVPKRSSEFTRLAAGFNRMADSLAEQRRMAAHEAEERLALERALRHSERLSALGRLAAGVAHEMGAPLNVIYTRAAQLLGNPDLSVDARQRNLTIIRAQAGRITRIVRQLLTLAHPGDLRREAIDLASLVAVTVDIVEADAARSGISIEVAPDKDVSVDVDKELLHQVLCNICLNAIQAMPSGGRLRIQCLREAERREDRSFAAVLVSDTGTGIAQEHHALIFEPFYTTKEVGRGTGLGLAVSRRIVE